MSGPQQYFKKPPTFQAMQWKPGTPEAAELETWLFRMDFSIQRSGSSLRILNTIDPKLFTEVREEDWVVRTGGAHNEIVIMGNREFQQQYVLSDEQEPF